MSVEFFVRAILIASLALFTSACGGGGGGGSDAAAVETVTGSDTDTDEKVVLKTPSVNFEDDPAYLERFQLEEWIGRRIDSAHVIRTVEQIRPRRFMYYVMEYIEGQTLEQWMVDQTDVDLTVIRNIVSQTVSGLRAFHRMDMLHQDIKPGNIMITAEGLVKIVDFGSTKIAGIADISTPVQRSELLGTKNYTAPEYLLGESGTARSDMFSLGCIIYEMFIIIKFLCFANKSRHITHCVNF
ncbi:MAG: serine/threonine protein kinase, partial [Colwellia sp.]|nr:serine/threonine protein kinase [Colwellia sp.]